MLTYRYTMTLNSLKELDKLMVMCRKRGVKSITIDGVTFHMSDQELADTQNRVISTSVTQEGITPGGITADTKIVTDELTEDQLLFYSARSEAFESQ